MAAAPGAGAEGGPQLSELESLQLKANKITDESLESTRRMITLCEEVGPNLFIMIRGHSKTTWTSRGG